MDSSKVLEINLISAQNLKPPSSNIRRLQTYAVVWIDPATKLRTRLDRVGSENPTWNDKFLFKVSDDFLSRETSGVSFEIYAVGCLRNPLVGTVRFLISNLSSSADSRTPSFVAIQIRRPSGRFHGVLNIGVSVTDGSEFPSLNSRNGASAIGYRDLMGESIRRRRPPRQCRELKKPECDDDSLHGDYSTEDTSDGADSTTSSTSSSNASTAAAALKEWNAVREFAGKNGNQLRVASADGFGMMCGLFVKRRFSFCPSDVYRGGSLKENR